MARKKIPARPRDRFRDESLLLRSAETLGRVIGTLQRQLDVATGRLTNSAIHADGAKKTRTTTRSGATAKSGTASRGGALKKSASASRSKTPKRRSKKNVKRR